ncbi:MAG TPA: transglutaminase domain-containing protein [Gaiellaceae bacterium]|nr:transglutaminase domain-containing protein [Gaiellaceae bacterium]
MPRTLAAALVPALTISFAWVRLEEPRLTGEVLAVAALAVLPALVPRWWQRAFAFVLVSGVAAWIVSGARPWDLPPFRDAPVVEPVVRNVSTGLGDFYGVVLPFAPGGHPEMHMLVLAAIFGFVAATALLVAARLPLAAAAVTLAGAGWPATLLDTGSVAVGALALAAALSIFVALRVRSVPALVAGAAVASLVISGAAWASSATTLAQQAVLDWEKWDFRGIPAKALGVRFVWDANYDGVAFPRSPTVVLEIKGPERAQYWRVSTLDRFSADRWLEAPYAQVIGGGEGAVPLDALAPPRARARGGWLEQRVQVKALVDDRIAAAGTPVSLSAKSVGTVFYLAGGAIRARRALDAGTRYTVWSYVPDPSPAALAATQARYPRAASRYLTVWGKTMPAFGSSRREAAIRELVGGSPRAPLNEYAQLYERARAVAAGAESPYAAVLALEAWFRQEGGFRYDEQPPRTDGLPPLVHFVEVTRAGYCQHYAGAMAVMLRLLGIPSRVAVGFTSGTRIGDTWRVTDHNAHAWVEVWFPRYGWVAFDPTPGRGTFAGIYSFASENAQAVELLGRGALDDVTQTGVRGFTEREAGTRPFVEGRGRPSLLSVVLGLAIVGSGAIGGGKWLVRRLRYLTRDPRKLAAASRHELEEFLRDQGVPLPTSPTLHDLRRAVELEIGVDGRAYAEAAGRGRFGRPEAIERSARTARRELRTLLRRARDELSPWARARGFVSLRSVRGSAL